MTSSAKGRRSASRLYALASRPSLLTSNTNTEPSSPHVKTTDSSWKAARQVMAVL